jgi:hypothetical protein
MAKRGVKPRSLADRFWEKVDVRGPDECWPWTASMNHAGYGTINEGGLHGSGLIASRVAWELVNGPIPDGMDICHSCDNPPCCNPGHLSPAPHVVNIADMMAKGRNARGETNGQSKLTAAQAEEIRHAAGLQREIAAQFGISRRQVGDIKRGKYWPKHGDLENGRL